MNLSNVKNKAYVRRMEVIWDTNTSCAFMGVLRPIPKKQISSKAYNPDIVDWVIG